MRARARLAILAVTLLTAAIGALGLTSPASAAASPKVGQCHQLTWRQAMAVADGKRAVSCSARHNLQTIAIVTSPVSLAGLTVDEQAELGSRLCTPKFARALGRTAAKREQTVYSLFFFAPTSAQMAAGDRRIRCDVGKLAASQLASLPKRRLARPIVSAHIGDADRRCLTARWNVTPCSSKHMLRSTGAFVVRRSSYPTDDQLAALGDRKCPRDTDALVWPSEVAWEHGNHVLVCYDKTKR